MTAVLRVNPGLGLEAIRAVFSRSGRAHVADVLQSEGARALHRALVEFPDWQLSLQHADKHYDLTREQLELMPSAQQVLLVDRMNQTARTSFQYVFNNIPIYDLYLAGRLRDPMLVQAVEFLNSPGFLDFARQVTGMQAIAFADAQATLYRPGHFLTVHDDGVEGKNRLAAYVLSLTEQWRADWGGILQFIDQDGHVAEGYTPTFNALNLLRVPQKHCVSYVTPAAAGGRYSITGWLRSN
jgi:Rps23 Pro-64 3,4-dihydroxylase Tpa1-like proline 4-hydroxylase